jgi:Bifunctional DNA primase/polymerase, N-terminal
MPYSERQQDRPMQETLNNLPLRDAAVFYAQHGWPVFPLHGKVPYKFLLPEIASHGHKDATTNQEQIHAWWTYHPGANIGLPTGEPSGVLVVDMDVPDGYYNLKALQARYDTLPETRTSHTAGGGMHYFYQYPQTGTDYHGTVGLDQLIGIDIRAQGNYVVLPPSRLYGRKAYRWTPGETPIAQAPDWLLRLLSQAEEQRQKPQQGMRFASSTGEKWFDEAIAKAREGNRNATGFWLARMLRNDGISQQDALRIVLAYANRVPQGERPAYTSQEAAASVKSAYQRPAQERPRSV